jgi:hypothetical protein
LDRRRNNLCWLLCALGLLTGLTLLPGQALGDAPAQGPDATPTLPPAVWLTPVGGEALVLLLLGGAALVGVVVFLLRRKKPPGAARPAPAAAPRYTLVVQAGPGAGARYPLTQAAVTLGRGPDCQVVINHPNVSSHHARLIWDGRQVVVQDLGSTNGTFVNDYRITEPVLFRSGDVLSLGRVVRLVLQAGG